MNIIDKLFAFFSFGETVKIMSHKPDIDTIMCENARLTSFNSKKEIFFVNAVGTKFELRNGILLRKVYNVWRKSRATDVITFSALLVIEDFKHSNIVTGKIVKVKRLK